MTVMRWPLSVLWATSSPSWNFRCMGAPYFWFRMAFSTPLMIPCCWASATALLDRLLDIACFRDRVVHVSRVVVRLVDLHSDLTWRLGKARWQLCKTAERQVIGMFAGDEELCH